MNTFKQNFYVCYYKQNTSKLNKMKEILEKKIIDNDSCKKYEQLGLFYLLSAKGKEIR